MSCLFLVFYAAEPNYLVIYTMVSADFLSPSSVLRKKPRIVAKLLSSWVRCSSIFLKGNFYLSAFMVLYNKNKINSMASRFEYNFTRESEYEELKERNQELEE